MPLLDWQEYLINEASKVDDDNNFIHRNVVAVAARQNGKTHLLRMRILAGLYIWDEELQIATAQTRDLSLEVFRSIVATIDNHDWLRKKVKQLLDLMVEKKYRLKAQVHATKS